jgi:hypothetical protein
MCVLDVRIRISLGNPKVFDCIDLTLVLTSANHMNRFRFRHEYCPSPPQPKSIATDLRQTSMCVEMRVLARSV